MRKSSRRTLVAASAAIVFNWVGGSAARADTPVSWANPAASGSWSDAADWSPAVSPNGAYAVTLPAGSETVTLDISPSIDSLVLDSGAILRTNTGTSLTTGSLSNSGQVIFTSGGTLTINGATTNSDDFYIGEGTTATITGNVTNSGTFQTGYGSGNSTVTVSGTFSNSSADALELLGSGDVVKVNALSNLGNISVDTGTTLDITGGGSGVTDVVAGSQYSIAGSFNVINGVTTTSALANLASVEGTLILLGGQTFDFGSLTNSHDFYIGEGTTAAITGNVTNSGTFQTGYGSGNSTVTVSGTFSNTSTGTLSLNGSGDVVKVNTLSNLGTVTVPLNTTLDITGGGSGVTDVASGTSYQIGGSFNVINGVTTTSALANLASVEGTLVLLEPQTFDFGSLTTSHSFNVGEGATATITGNVTNSDTFLTGYGGGSNTVTVSGTFSNTSTGGIYLDSSTDVVTINTLINAGTVSIASGAMLKITGSLTTMGGSMALAETEAYAGGTTLNGGTLTFGALADLGTGNINFGGGALEWASGNTADISTRTVTINTGGATLNTNGNNVTFANSIGNGGTGGLQKSGAGTLTLSASNSYSGGTTISGGTLIAAANNALPANGAVVNNSALTVNGNDTTGAISGTGSLTVGTGSSNNTLKMAANSPQSSQASITVNTGATLDITNNSIILTPTAGTQAAALANYLSLVQQGYNSGSWTGTGITSSTVAAANAVTPLYGIAVAEDDGSYGTVTGLASGQIEIAEAVIGDATLSGTVNFADFVKVEGNYGLTGADWDEGDFFYTGTVNFADFVAVEANFGDTNAISAPEMAAMQSFAGTFGDTLVANPSGVGFQVVAVPEPASAGLLALAGMGILGRRKRRKAAP